MRPRVHSPADLGRLDGDELLTPHEVALLFGVNTKTLGRWARQGRITAQWTLGGHRRFPAAEVARALADMSGHHPEDQA